MHDILARTDPLVTGVGARIRLLRSKRGLSRKSLARQSMLSERHLSTIEQGLGNASILVLNQIATALECPLAELLGDVTTRSPEWLLIRELLQDRNEGDLRRARTALTGLLDPARSDGARSGRIALVGLRGAGKTTLGTLLADSLEVPFVELSLEIEKIAGCSVQEIHDLYGINAYRRYERRALEETIQLFGDAVIATPGGIVSDAATFNELLTHCTTVWLRASPQEYMDRVVAQGDTRPMAHNLEAMDDLRRILDGRSAFYSRADFAIDTSRKSQLVSLDDLRCALASLACLEP